MFVDNWDTIKMRGGYSPEFIRRAEEARRNPQRQALREQRQEMTRQMFRDRGVPPSVKKIIVQCAEEAGAEPYDMLVKNNQREMSVARHKAIYLIKSQDLTRSSTRIAKWFGKDHTSILSAIARHAQRTGEPPIGEYKIQERRKV